jgi:hypothetical protein
MPMKKWAQMQVQMMQTQPAGWMQLQKQRPLVPPTQQLTQQTWH